MKALSVRQPWAYLIVSGQKDIENRTWATKYRGRIVIHASQSKGVRPLPPECYGALVGEVDIVDCVAESESRWFTGPYGFVLANPKAYEKPIPYKGQLGLFEVMEGRGEWTTSV